MPLSLRGDYLKNTDFSEGFTCWHGDGEPAFLKPDGTEGTPEDKGAVAVIRMALSKGEPHFVYQEYDGRNNIKNEHLTVEVFASSDFKRSTFTTDYAPGMTAKAGDFLILPAAVVLDVDFWLRAGPGFFYKLSELKPGQWVTVDGLWQGPLPAENRAVYYFVPPGHGTIYLRKPSVAQSQ